MNARTEAKRSSTVSWIACNAPALQERLKPAVIAILEKVAAESQDKSACIYTQAEMVRAIELATAKTTTRNQP